MNTPHGNETRDAAQAAANMRGFDYVAECKYLAIRAGVTPALNAALTAFNLP
jgi:hypothetical protein